MGGSEVESLLVTSARLLSIPKQPLTLPISEIRRSIPPESPSQVAIYYMWQVIRQRRRSTTLEPLVITGALN